MALPVAATRLFNGLQDGVIDSDDAPFYQAKTGFTTLQGLIPSLMASLPFVARATRGDLTSTGFAPQGLFVGAFTQRASVADLTLTGFAPQSLGQVSWRAIPSPLSQINRTVAFPQYITAIKANYLIDPQNTVTSVSVIAGDAVPAGVAQYDVNNVLIGYGPAATPLGVMYGRTGILKDDLIYVLQQPANAAAAVTLKAGGGFDAPTAPTGRHFFAWEWWHSATNVTEQFSWFFVVP